MKRPWLRKIERAVLWTLSEIRGCVEMSVIARFVFHGNENMTLDECLSMPEPTKSQYNTVNRAVASLERKGHVQTSTSSEVTDQPGPKTLTMVQLAGEAQEMKSAPNRQLVCRWCDGLFLSVTSRITGHSFPTEHAFSSDISPINAV